MGLVADYMVGRSEILECGTTFRCVYMQNFLFVRLTVEMESKIKHCPLNDPPPFYAVCPWTRIFHAKAVYTVLGSSYLSARKILALGKSTSICI